MMIHLVNAAGILADSGKTGSLPAPLKFPRLDKLPGGRPAINITVRHPGVRAELLSPEFTGRRELEGSSP